MKKGIETVQQALDFIIKQHPFYYANPSSDVSLLVKLLKKEIEELKILGGI